MGEDVRPVHRYHADDPWAAESGEWVRYEDHAAVVAALEAERDEASSLYVQTEERRAADAKRHDEEIAVLEAQVECAQANHDAALDLLDAARAEVERLRGVLRDLLTLRDDDRGGRRVDKSNPGPGHAHRLPGIWDPDNGALAGHQCEWCAVWERAEAALDAARKEG